MNFLSVILLLCVLFGCNTQKEVEEKKVALAEEDEKPDYWGLFDRGETPRNYIINGNFYSQDKPSKLGIDVSYIDKVDTAIWWYDKVIDEFPGTEEANEALRQKIRTLIGWVDGYGDDKEKFGLENPSKRGKYLPLVEATFLELETDYPDDEYLEAFAFQIAQQYLILVVVYRREGSKDYCKKWLEKTIALAGGKDTFYSHLSKLRLRLVQ